MEMGPILAPRVIVEVSLILKAAVFRNDGMYVFKWHQNDRKKHARNTNRTVGVFVSCERQRKSRQQPGKTRNPIRVSLAPS